ncbi:DUF3885 domain-containing protein [Alkalihalobacterium elongatum]|uniref:DUF3885 domain-containing protein n=1 Tax=Alkalihalobacterium elongatum TaxID=2675466 RepID=UPI001C1F6FCB|nr:DUF3885 domain-containing protein [Alkalihalobacterium elongatum]
MHLKEFMNDHFPNLEFRPPLFYSWEIGLRFELGVNYDSDNVYVNCPYLQGVYERAITLFQSLHSSDDDLFIVVDVNDYADGEAFKHKLNVFHKYVNDKSVLYKLQKNTIPYIYPEDDDGIWKTHRFCLKCKLSDIQYTPMLKAICNQDMGIKPNIFHSVYFINIDRKTIFYIYDDRGCDLLASSTETIRDVYEKYNDWILDYDRNRIDDIFK